MDKKINWSIFLIIAFLFLALYGIVERIWVSEDAYITFKHIDNLFAGNGLNFNKGERVEGFTHPLWAFALIILRLLGLPTHQSSICLGIIFSIGSLAFSFYFLSKTFTKSIFILPVILIPNIGYRDFSTSGLEFPLTFFLLSVFFFFTFGKEIQNKLAAFSILSLLYLTRPEFGLFLFYYGLIYLIKAYKERDLKSFFQICLPVLILAGGYHIFRLFYYSDIFPNTYYAKSGGDSNYLQGLKYLSHTIRYSPLLVPAFLLFLLSIPRILKNDFSDGKYILRDTFVLLILIFYIVRVGGDFMAFRFLLPSIAIFGMIVQFYLNKWWNSKNFSEKQTIILNSVFFAISLYATLYSRKIPIIEDFIVNERQIFTRELNQGLLSRFQEIRYPWYLEGLKFNELEHCINYKDFIITNSIANAKCASGFGLGYFSVAAGTNVVLIDELGLTDKTIAKQKRLEIFRPGHERMVGLDYLIQRGTLFCSLNNPEYDEVMKTRFGVIINLSPDFLFRLGKNEYLKRIGKLKELFLKTRYSSDKQGKEIHNWLLLLEQRYKIKIIDLPDSVPSEFEKFDKCW